MHETMNLWAIVPAAGKGARLASSLNGQSKQFFSWNNIPLFWHAAKALVAAPQLRGIIFAFPQESLDTAKAQCTKLALTNPLGVAVRSVAGGASRSDSVRNALCALPPTCTHVLVHDAARPFAKPDIIQRVMAALTQGAACAIPVLPVKDTVKRVDDSGRVLGTPDRSELYLIQTPQGFQREILQKAHEQFADETVTDDASLVEKMGLPVLTVPGDESNIKITTPDDLGLLREHDARESYPCTGFGYDVHAYGGNRLLRLGGVLIPGEFTVKAHSDGDVLLHALTDAILGCAGLGDIGDLFSDTDPANDNISSSIMLTEALELASRFGVRVLHADVTVIAQAPKLAPYKMEIQKNVAHLLHLSPSCVSVKATTEEKLGFTGALQGLKAVAVVSAFKRS